MIKQKQIKLLLAGISLLLLGLVIGWYARINYAASLPSRLIEVRENDSQYHYINPLLLVDLPREAPEYDSLKKKITDYTDRATKNGSASSISVYFRDLNSGRWTGVNQDALYDPSSMLKVAVMIGYLKEAVDNPGVLAKELPYVAKVDPGQHYPPPHPLQTGTYTVRSLIEAMIVDSDNAALDALFNNDETNFIATLKDLAIPPPPTITTTDFMSPRTYSTIFRTLYSSTYLPRPVSEQALQLLTYTDFKLGLVAGVSTTTVVAHKFGEHTKEIAGVVVARQLHDCGIVYYPTHPYLLCVMTRGMDFEALQTIISDLSRLVYQHLSS